MIDTINKETLRFIMIKEFGIYGFDVIRKYTYDALENEKFEDIGRVQDWRNHIDGGTPSLFHFPEFIKYWKSLDDVTRLIKFCKAYRDAQNEEWD